MYTTLKLIAILGAAALAFYNAYKNRKLIFGIGLTDIEKECKKDFKAIRLRLASVKDYGELRKAYDSVWAWKYYYDSTGADRKLVTGQLTSLLSLYTERELTLRYRASPVR